jgi:hypothetical protein
MICYLYTKPAYLFFLPEVPQILYYSHIPKTIIALLVGTLVYLSGRNNILNKLFFLLCISFSVWTISSLFAWTNLYADFLAFIWPLFAISASLLSILSVYFVYVFLEKRDVHLRTKLIFLLLLLPILLLAHTDVNISGFNLTNCDAFDYEGVWFKKYYTALGAISMIWISGLLYKKYRQADIQVKKQIIYTGIGIEFFLFSFLSTTFVVSYLVNLGILPDSRLEMYGLFGMVIFMIMITIQIVKFKSFNVALSGTTALVGGLIILVGSQITFNETTTGRVLSLITLILTIVSGFLLLRSCLLYTSPSPRDR